jgi:uncharacterized protein YwqG
MQAAGGPDWLPQDGRLLFFYDVEHGGWGFGSKDAGSAVVRYEVGLAGRAAAPTGLAPDASFPDCPVRFIADVSFPDEGRLKIDWRTLSGSEERALEDALQAMEPAEPAHQAGGYPQPIQNDGMELECQLVTKGLYLGKGYDTTKADEFRGGAADWRLLLQLDTDETAGMMWGDTGRLYYWIREQDARAGDFSRTWTILQCF